MELTKVELPTFFAPAERASLEELQDQLEEVTNNPMVDALMWTLPGLLGILNAQRQLIALNTTLLQLLGVSSAEAVFGLRLGEALHCIHAQEEPGGCGTSRFCGTCGAAIAMVTALAHVRPARRECAITVQQQGQVYDLYFDVQCTPFEWEGQSFLLLFLHDMTLAQKRAALQRLFFHDMSNWLSALQLNLYLLERRSEKGEMDPSLARRVRQLVVQLQKEVEIQRALLQEDAGAYQVDWQPVLVAEFLYDLRELLVHYAVAQGKRLHLLEPLPSLQLITDRTLLQRVLINMLVNAFEATEVGDEVRLWLETAGSCVTFCVWNRQAISETVARRVFQRNFSTKDGMGRGLGTYAMKLFGETYLQGRVNFTTSPTEGTTFRISLPRQGEGVSAPDR